VFDGLFCSSNHQTQQEVSHGKSQTRNPVSEDEIAFIKHFDKQRQEWVLNPKAGSRLRQTHEGNEAPSIKTNIVKSELTVEAAFRMERAGGQILALVK
jgi:hypothetical protein